MRNDIQTRFNTDTAKAASARSVEVRRKKAAERAKIRSIWNDKVDEMIEDFAAGKPVMGSKLSAEIRARMIEQMLLNAMIQKMNLAAKFEYEADLLELKNEIKQEESTVDRDPDNAGLTSTDIMNLLGTHSESVSSQRIITIENNDIQEVPPAAKEGQLFIDWYNELKDRDYAGQIIDLSFNGSQSEFLAHSDRLAIDVIRERGI